MEEDQTINRVNTSEDEYHKVQREKREQLEERVDALEKRFDAQATSEPPKSKRGRPPKDKEKQE